MHSNRGQRELFSASLVRDGETQIEKASKLIRRELTAARHRRLGGSSTASFKSELKIHFSDVFF